MADYTNSDYIESNSPGDGSSSVSKNISQSGHGFVLGQPVYFNGTSYAPSVNTAIASSEVDGIVSKVINSSAFVISTNGYVSGLVGLTLVPGDSYFVPPTAGVMTNTPPVSNGSVNKPIFRADSTTSGYIENYRGELISAPGAVDITAGVIGNLPVQNLNGGSGASATTFWRGDGTWATISGSGTVTNVATNSSLTGGPITTTGTLGLNLASANTMTAMQSIQLTTQQFSLNYDGTNKSAFTTDSSGNLTIAPTGALMTITGALTVTTNLIAGSVTSNIFVSSAAGAGNSTTTSQYQYAGSTANVTRSGFYGNSSTSIATGRNYSSVMFANPPISVAASAVIPWVSNVVIKAVGTITLGSGASVTNTASLYVDSPSTTGTNNYSLYVNGNIGIQKTITATGTTGAQTINKPSGSVNFALGASSLVVTNSLVDANSNIQATIEKNDSSFTSVQITRTTGSFTIFSNAPASSETRVDFLVTN